MGLASACPRAMLEGVNAAPIPPLPDAWPFKVRCGASVAQELGPGGLPGLGDGWLRFGGEVLATLSGDSEVLSGRFGRGGLRRAGEAILRPYRRGGLVRHFNARRYLSPARFAQEFRVHEALWRSGFPTPEPLGYAWRPLPAWGVEGVFITRHAAGQPWPRDWSRSAEVMAALGSALGALCAWGLWTPDLNATNVHLLDQGGVLLLDWDRADWGDATRLEERYRARLNRSLEKLQAPKEVLRELAAMAW